MKPEVSLLKAAVQGVYDTQKDRIAAGNRLVANFKIKLGVDPSVKEEENSKEINDTLDRLRLHYEKITEGVVKISKRVKLEKDGIISNHAELLMVKNWLDAIESEKTQTLIIKELLEDHPIYTEFLIRVGGCGPMMSAVIISSLDPTRAEYPSSFWKYCGLDVAPDGKGRSKKSEHLIEVEYQDKDGQTKTKKSITFKPFIKTKLVGVLGPGILKAHGKTPNKYGEIYYNYRNRLDNHPAHQDKVPAHKMRMSIRYMVKLFLIDLHQAWRKLEGLPVNPPYHEAKLGIYHHKESTPLN